MDYANESIFQDKNFDFGFWSQLVAGAEKTLTPWPWAFTTSVCTCILAGELLASSEISVQTLASCNDPFASNFNAAGDCVLHPSNALDSAL